MALTCIENTDRLGQLLLLLLLLTAIALAAVCVLVSLEALRLLYQLEPALTV